MECLTSVYRSILILLVITENSVNEAMVQKTPEGGRNAVLTI